MIEFRSIEVKNFLGVGNVPMGYTFSNGEAYLVCGTNGSGKSSILLDGLNFALYGTPFRNINNDQLVNSINEKDCLAVLKVVIDGKEYRIERGLKPRVFNIFENGVLRQKESTIPEQQKSFEELILKMDQKTFRQIVILGSKSYIPFMRLKASHRRAVIEDLLNIGIFSEMGAIIKEKLSAFAIQAREIDVELRLINQSIQSTQELLDNETNGTFQQKTANEINEFIQLRANKQQQRNCLMEMGREKMAEKRDLPDMMAVQRELDQYWKAENQGVLVKRRISKEIDFFRKEEVCPTCHQDIDHQFRELQLQRRTAEAETLETGFQKIRSLVADANEKLKAIREFEQQMAEIKAKIDGVDREIAEIQHSIEMVGSKLSDHKDELDKNRENLNRKIEELTSQLREVKDRQHQLLFDGRILSSVLEMVKDSGIRQKIIETYLPFINSQINLYLKAMNSDVHFVFDEMFNEIIKSRHRTEFSYDNFSEGEKLRIDLAVLFTFREISRKRNSSSTNLLIFDEIGDSSLDADGFDCFMKILKSNNEKQCFVIISHTPEKITSHVNRIYEYEKLNNFTHLKAYFENTNPETSLS